MSTALIALDHVDVHALGKRILHHISWRIAPGENWVVLGDNGAGKSTLLRLLRGEVWPDPKSSGTIRYNWDDQGLTASSVGVRENMVHLAAEKQEAYHQQGWNMDGLHAILTGLTDSAWYQGKPSTTELQMAHTVIDLLGIRALATQHTLAMSQGQLRKILLARLLVAAPRMILLDEFCNGLDMPSRAELLQLVDTVARLGVQVIYTTHRPEEVIPSISHALWIRAGRIVAQGKKEAVLAEFNHPHARTTKPRSTAHAVTAPTTGQATGSPLLRIHHAHVVLDGVRILHDLDWTMQREQNWAILGPNGSGKSTFLQLLFGNVSPVHGGQVVRFGSAAPATIWDSKRRMGYVSAALQTQYEPSATGREVVCSGFFASIGLYEPPTEAQQEKAQQLIDQWGLGDWSDRPFGTLSYGQARQLLIARALVQDPELLLLDEVCNGLDAPARENVLAMLETLVQTTPLRIVMVTHHLEELIPAIRHALLLKNGTITDSGLRELILRPERLQAVFRDQSPQPDPVRHEHLRRLFVRV
ncbi:MAG: ATP-binding cassette domain-containing protein [Magnetococcales bacterium]|nr:ATP-binding cassette domain-containing protein [Magnetococcales bacterium]